MQLAVAQVDIVANLDEFKKSMSTVQASLKNVGDKMKNVGANMTKFVTLPLIGAGVAGIKFASDLEESVNKVDVAFGNNADEIKKWSKETLRNFGIAQGSALDMAALFGDMSTSMGLTTGEASEMSKSLVGLAGDLASFKNIGISEAQTALKSIFTGETESLKNLGIVMTQTNLEAFAMSQGIQKNIKDMTQAEQVQLRYAYVMEMTTNAQGDFARTSDGAANQMRIFQESLKELSATFGAVLLPIFTKVITKINEMIQWFSGLSETTKTVIVVIGAVVAVIGPLLIVLGQMALGINQIIVLLPVLAKGLTVVSGALKAMFVSPLGLAVLAVAALIAIGVLLYKNWDEIIAKAKEIWAAMTDAFTKVVEVVQEKMTAVKEYIADKFKEIVDDFLGLKDKFFEAGKNIIDGIKEGIKSKINDVKETMKDLASDIRDFLPFSPAKVGPLKDLNKLNFGGTISDAIDAGNAEIQGSMNAALQVPEIGANATGAVNINVDLDGRTIASVMGQHLVNNIRVGTGARI